ncbi:hypothetical protein HOY82DRAFT_544235 [Tuber indicum]|nr:hypothetical protein HOY82DRAFT_544235 [Tuber indicum]
MSQRPRGRPPKSLEAQKTTKKISDRKRYQAKKTESTSDELFSNPLGIVSSFPCLPFNTFVFLVDKETDSGLEVADTLESLSVPSSSVNASLSSFKPTWRSESAASISDFEDITSTAVHKSSTPENSTISNRVHLSRKSHWPSVLGLENLLGDLNLHNQNSLLDSSCNDSDIEDALIETSLSYETSSPSYSKVFSSSNISDFKVSTISNPIAGYEIAGNQELYEDVIEDFENGELEEDHETWINDSYSDQESDAFHIDIENKSRSLERLNTPHFGGIQDSSMRQSMSTTKSQPNSAIEVIEISSDSETEIHARTTPQVDSLDQEESIELLLAMLKTNMCCEKSEFQNSKDKSFEAGESIDLHTLTMSLKKCLPANYPQPTKMGYSEELDGNLCSYLFCGAKIGATKSEIPRLFIPTNHQTFPIQSSYDIDSFIAKAKSLSIAKHGIRFQVCPNPLYNLTKDLHLSLPISESLLSGNIRIHNVPIHKIPHFRLGTIFSSFHLPLYVFLPQLYDFTSSTTTYLTNELLQKWMDIGFLPSLHQYYSADILQHLPVSFESAYEDIYARGRESGIKDMNNNSEMGRRQEIHYFLPEYCLEEVWHNMIQLSLRPGYHQFQDMFLLLDAKDLKLMTKGSTPEASGKKFWHFILQDINAQELDPSFQFLDLGQEIMSQEKESILLYKKCCIKSSIAKLKQRFSGLKMTTYTWALNSLSANRTIEYSKNSKLAKQGLHYSQSYSPIKCLFDAAGSFPFENSSLDYLSLSSELIKSWQANGPNGLGLSFDIKKLQQAYIHSRDRVLSALEGTKRRKMSFGVRQEHRLSYLLFQKLCSLQSSLEVGNVSATCLQYNNMDIFHYLETNFLRFGLGLEYSFTRINQTLNNHSDDLSKIFRMFLQFQKASYSHVLLESFGDLWRYNSIHNSKKDYPGLGMKIQLEIFNFAWLPLDTVDWQCWRLGEKYQNTSIFNFIQIHSGALHKSNSLLQKKEALDLVNQFGKLLSQINNSGSYNTYLILAYLGTMIIQRFRIDVWTSLEQFCECQWSDEGKIKLAKEGIVSLDYQNVIEFNPEKFTRIRQSNKYKYSLDERWEILFHWDDIWEKNDIRKTWRNWPYRLLFQKCYQTVQQVCGTDTVQSWEYLLVKSKFARSNFLLPSPSKQFLLQRHTVKGQATRIYWVPLMHSSWKDVNVIRKLPQKNQKQDRWEYWEIDYSLPIPQEYELPDQLYGESLKPEQIIAKVKRAPRMY